VNILKIKVPLRTKKQADVTKVEPSTSSTENLKTKKNISSGDLNNQETKH